MAVSEELMHKWYERGVRAAQRDGWLEPCYGQDMGTDNPIELLLLHRDRWEETDHFQILYRLKMLEDVDGLEGEERIEAVQDLIDAFWSGWEAEVDALSLIEQALAKEE